MNKIIFTTCLLLSLFSCKEKTDTSTSNAYKNEDIETIDKQTATPKFSDPNGCSQYTTLYEALPHLDTYKNMEFRTMECMFQKQSETASWTSLNTSYFDPESKNKMVVNFYEINGDVTVERDVINMVKTTYNEFTNMADFYKSSLTIFENASVNIMESNSEDEYSSATYLCSHKDKFALLIKIEMLGQMNLEKVDSFIKDYLQAISSKPLN
ncbi:hypothetical protein [Maribacter aquimaris]|nr:hypothetical protein [Maribacter aquimaris]